MINKSIFKTFIFSNLVVAFLLISKKSNAQQLPHYTQYLYNMQIVNPAYVGVRSDLSFSALSRQQWSGVIGAPETRTFSANARTILGIGVGATFVNDKIGLSDINNFNLDGSYTIVTSRNSRLSLGLKLGVTFFSNNLANGITPDNDFYESNSGQFFNAGFGMLYYNEKFFLGLSVPYILESPQFYIQPASRTIELAKNMNFFLASGYLLELSEEFTLKPSTMIRYTVNAPLSLDLNANIIYNNAVEAGLSYRWNSSINALFAVNINKKLRIGYAYDYKLDPIIGNFNTHEVILHFEINLKRNTRWLEDASCYF